MNWFRRMMVGGMLVGVGAAASAQEPGGGAIRLGMPTPLADSAGAVGSLLPMPAPVVPGVQRRQAARPLPAPTVVRAASAVFDDEPKQPFVPIFLPPVVDAPVPLAAAPELPAVPPLPTTAPAAAPPQKKIDPAPPAIQPVQSKQTILEIGKTGNLIVIADSAQDCSPQAKASVVIYDDSALLTGNSGFAWNPNAGQSERFYVGAEYLQWWTRGMHLPPLVTTASANDNPATQGALGFQTTRLIYGDNTVLNGSQPGGRFTVGYNFDPCGFCAFEATFFFLGRNSDGASFGSNEFPVIGRPFFNINTGLQDRELTTEPGLATGNLQVRTSSTLWGGELNNRFLLWDCCGFRLTGLVGLRYLDLHDQLSINENTTFITAVFPANAVAGTPPLFNAGDRTFVFDQFATRNQFYGGQIGANAEWQRGPWSLDAHVKVALGATEQSVDIAGGQQFNRVNGTVQNFQGGLYALSSNIGHYSQTRFAAVPEVGLKVGYDLTDHIQLFVGYDLLYWSSVLRAGDQIDTSLDANKIPNFGATFPAANQVRPLVPLQTSAYWAQGFNAGIMIRY